jgi:hypothetical protein
LKDYKRGRESKAANSLSGTGFPSAQTLKAISAASSVSPAPKNAMFTSVVPQLRAESLAAGFAVGAAVAREKEMASAARVQRENCILRSGMAVVSVVLV